MSLRKPHLRPIELHFRDHTLILKIQRPFLKGVGFSRFFQDILDFLNVPMAKSGHSNDDFDLNLEFVYDYFSHILVYYIDFLKPFLSENVF